MKNVNIAFCFDKNLWKQFCVSVASLLVNSENKCHYNIYAIVSENITDTEKNYMKNVVSKYDEKSNITFLTDNHDFDILYKPAYFFRLQLLKLNNIDKIIYCDIDTFFNGNLVSLYDTNLGNNLFS